MSRGSRQTPKNRDDQMPLKTRFPQISVSIKHRENCSAQIANLLCSVQLISSPCEIGICHFLLLGGKRLSTGINVRIIFTYL